MKKRMPLLALLILLTGGLSACGKTAQTNVPVQTPSQMPAPLASTTPSPAPEDEAPSITATPTTDAPHSSGQVKPEPMPVESVLLEESAIPQPEGPTDEQVLEAYHSAEEAYSWFELAPLPLDRTEETQVGDQIYYRVDDAPVQTMAELRGYLKRLFSDGLVEQLLPAEGGRYIEQDGVLYGLDGGRGADITKGGETLQVLREEGAERCTVRVTVELLNPEQNFAPMGSESHDFLYEKVGENWIFTSFSLVR